MDGDLNALDPVDRNLAHRAHQMFMSLPMARDAGIRPVNIAWLAVRNSLEKNNQKNGITQNTAELEKAAKNMVFRFLTEIATEEGGGEPFSQEVMERKLKDKIQAWQKEADVLPEEPREIVIAREIMNILQDSGKDHVLRDEINASLASLGGASKNNGILSQPQAILSAACVLAGREVAEKRETEERVDIFNMLPDKLHQFVANHVKQIIEQAEVRQQTKAIWDALPTNEDGQPTLLDMTEDMLLASANRMQRKGGLIVPRNLALSHACREAAMDGLTPDGVTPDALSKKLQTYILRALDTTIEQKREEVEARVDYIKGIVSGDEVLRAGLLEHAKRKLGIFTRIENLNASQRQDADTLITHAITAMATDQINDQTPAPSAEDAGGLLEALKEHITGYYQSHRDQLGNAEGRARIVR